MKDSTNMLRVPTARRTSLSLTALLAIGAAAQADTLQDPTRPATLKIVAQAADAGALQLEAIMDSGARRVAIVNGKVVRAGDRVGTAVIEAIDGDSIRYTRNGRSETARLAKDTLRVRQSARRHENEAR
jgi:MSHA biogenesis protein MshK